MIPLSSPKNGSYITDVALVLDESSSMDHLTEEMITVVDNQVKFLAQLSQAQDHEVRVSVYTFSDADRIKCLIYSKDVLRLPSIRGMYAPNGWTALADAAILAIEDLKMVPTKYGDHAFLVFLFTDGQENRSRRAIFLPGLIEGLDESWTVAAFVPDVNGRLMMGRLGVPSGNISIWDASSKEGMREAGETMRTAMDSYMTMRSTGVSGTRDLFSTASDAVNAQTIKAAGLTPLKAGDYDIIAVPKPRADRNQGVLNKDKVRVWEIEEFVSHAKGKGSFVAGNTFYLLAKKEMIQADKKLAVVEKATNKVFVGDGVRAMIGLPDKNKSVAPDFNPDYELYVQSKSTNRHLFTGNKILILA